MNEYHYRNPKFCDCYEPARPPKQLLRRSVLGSDGQSVLLVAFFDISEESVLYPAEAL